MTKSVPSAVGGIPSLLPTGLFPLTPALTCSRAYTLRGHLEAPGSWGRRVRGNEGA